MSPRRKKITQKAMIGFPILFAVLAYVIGFIYISNEVDNSYHNDDFDEKHKVYYIWAGGTYETEVWIWTYEYEYDDIKDWWELQDLEPNRVFFYAILIAFAAINAIATKRIESGIIFGIIFAFCLLISGYIGEGTLSGDRDDWDILTSNTTFYIIFLPLLFSSIFALAFQMKK